MVHVLAADWLQVWSRGLMLQWSTAAEGARSLLRFGRRPLAGGSNAVTVHGPTRTGRTTDGVVSLQELSVTRLEAVTAEDEGGVLATLADETFRSLALDEHDQVSVVAEYPEWPWFAKRGAAPCRDDHRHPGRSQLVSPVPRRYRQP